MKYSTRKYHKNECITFKSTKGEYGSLSNMAPGYVIKINNQIIRSSELLYQALRFSKYPEIQKVIISIKSPITAKKYGRKHLDKTREDWLEYRFGIMRFCIALKLLNNFDRFSKVLLDTNTKAIVEYSEKDKVWGASKQGNYYIGTNALGRLLMELREKVRNGDVEIFNMNIPNLILMNENILQRITVPNKNNNTK